MKVSENKISMSIKKKEKRKKKVREGEQLVNLPGLSLSLN